MHDESITFNDELVVPRVLRGWSGRVEADEISVSGPCPTCGGPAYGPALLEAFDTDEPEVGPLLAGDEEGRIVDIRAVCDCGFGHGKADEANCGRYWFVRVSFQQ